MSDALLLEARIAAMEGEIRYRRQQHILVAARVDDLCHITDSLKVRLDGAAEEIATLRECQKRGVKYPKPYDAPRRPQRRHANE